MLAVLKGENSKDLDKKREVEVLLGKCDNEFFQDLVTIASTINDYTLEVQKDNADRYEEELSVNLDLDEVNSYQQ